MKCRSVKIETDKADDGRHVVKLVVGNKPERVGKHFAVNQVAWVEMSPGMARSIAADLLEVANEVEKAPKPEVERARSFLGSVLEMSDEDLQRLADK